MRFHTPVLLAQVCQQLNIKKGKKYIDATAGGGGHTQAILKAGGQVLVLDWDPAAIEHLKGHLKSVCPNALYQIVRGNFTHLKQIAAETGFKRVAGILFDLGVSSYQLETVERGFSFQKEAPLDMRMDPRLAVTAADLLKVLSKKQLDALFTQFTQEKRARAIADALVRAREIKPIATTKQLADLVVRVYGGKKKIRRIHPATKVFLSLRMVVNSELNNLEEALPQAVDLLDSGGRLLVISFHESEDRITKRFFKNEPQLKILTKKPIRPSESEVKQNPRCRSAKLRAAAKSAPWRNKT